MNPTIQYILKVLHGSRGQGGYHAGNTRLQVIPEGRFALARRILTRAILDRGGLFNGIKSLQHVETHG